MNDPLDPRQVDWRIGVGLNRMRWLALPVHWMVETTMRSWDGSAAWTEKAHYVAIGPLRLFIEPSLLGEVAVAIITERETD